MFLGRQERILVLSVKKYGYVRNICLSLCFIITLYKKL